MLEVVSRGSFEELRQSMGCADSSRRMLCPDIPKVTLSPRIHDLRIQALEYGIRSVTP